MECCSEVVGEAHIETTKGDVASKALENDESLLLMMPEHIMEALIKRDNEGEIRLNVEIFRN